MENNIRIVNKKVGQTPLDCINEIKKIEPNLSHLPLTYAGRLDPLASGVLPILIGDGCLKKDEYLKLEKVYEVEMLFGSATDTYDVMGLVAKRKELFDKDTSLENNRFERSSDEGDGSRCQTISNRSFSSFVFEIQNILPQFIGRIKQLYPPYSSRTVNGKPLYQWAREGKINEIIIPSHDVFIEKIEIIKEDFISGNKLLNRIQKDISLVGGDFRRSEIIDIWQNILKDKEEEKYKAVTLRISCGSGVYVRGIAHEIGKKLGIPSLALKIVRTKVGEYEFKS